jgi:beta-glucosidase
MKRFLFVIFTAVVCQQIFAQAKNTDNGTDKKVAELLSKMTLEEKVGQMTQVTLGVVGTNIDGELNPPH